MAVSLRWTKNIKDKKEQKEFMSEISSSKRVLKRLGELVVEELDLCDKHLIDKNAYHIPNWNLYQADTLGEKRAYLKILKLIDLEKNDG